LCRVCPRRGIEAGRIRQKTGRQLCLFRLLIKLLDMVKRAN
jgi:hypothetical protein